ncbi:MAG: hypothetical protein LC790_23350, partial [Actinobacteria bacterium]|nr:hypothetical protein [Actinomycetota bacterium]MCA1701667.1 hypothetical protein [Actinomycetota bacterium]
PATSCGSSRRLGVKWRVRGASPGLIAFSAGSRGRVKRAGDVPANERLLGADGAGAGGALVALEATARSRYAAAWKLRRMC